MHSWGRASGLDLLEIVGSMSLWVLMPIQTERSGCLAISLKGEGKEVHLPERGQKIVLAS